MTTEHENITPDTTNDSDAAGTPSSRRAMMIGSAGAAAAVVVGLASGEKAAAADGDAILAGRANTAATSTALNGAALVVSDDRNSGSLARAFGGVETGVLGTTSNSVNNRAVWGVDETTGGVGVYGSHGDIAGAGTGVVAESTNGIGLRSAGTTFDALFEGTGRINLVESGVIGPTTPGLAGTVARSSDGSLWFAVGDNRWSLVAAAAGGSGGFVPIDPTRVYDSRAVQPSPGPIGVGGFRRVSIRSGRDLVTGIVTEADIVPAGATAVSFNVTIDRTAGSGFLTVAPGDATTVKSSTINWDTSGQTIANSGIVKVASDGVVRLFVGGPAGSTDVIIDITGYYT